MITCRWNKAICMKYATCSGKLLTLWRHRSKGTLHVQSKRIAYHSFKKHFIFLIYWTSIQDFISYWSLTAIKKIFFEILKQLSLNFLGNTTIEKLLYFPPLTVSGEESISTNTNTSKLSFQASNKDTTCIEFVHKTKTVSGVDTRVQMKRCVVSFVCVIMGTESWWIVWLIDPV